MLKLIFEWTMQPHDMDVGACHKDASTAISVQQTELNNEDPNDFDFP